MLQRSASATLITIAPPPSPSPHSTTCFLSTDSRYRREIQESSFSTVADAIPYKLHPHLKPHEDTTNNPPVGIRKPYLLRSESWREDAQKALCHLRCPARALCFFLTAELIWKVKRFADGEIVSPVRTEAHSVCSVTLALPCQGGVAPVLGCYILLLSVSRD